MSSEAGLVDNVDMVRCGHGCRHWSGHGHRHRVGNKLGHGHKLRHGQEHEMSMKCMRLYRVLFWGWILNTSQSGKLNYTGHCSQF